MAGPEPAAFRIPLTVIGGFLGAGKTTLLNRVLTRSTRRAAVLVNDFGPINIDAELVARHDGDTISLSNGCVCCSIGSGLEDALCRVLALDPPPEWIVIEASGVSDPARIAQVGMADPALQLESVVVVADAAQLRAQADDPLLADTVRRQIDAAGLLILNKTDLATPEQIAALRGWLDTLVPGLPVIQAVESDVDIEQTMTAAALPEPARATAPAGHDAGHAITHGRGHDHEAGHGHETGHGHGPGPGDKHGHGHEHAPGHASGRAHGRVHEAGPHHEHGHGHAHGEEHGQHPAGHSHGSPDHPFASWFWTARGDVSADALAAALKRLPRSVIRAKGWVRSDRHGIVLVQYAGRRVRFDTRTPPPASPQTGLVLIALRATADPHAAARLLDTALLPREP